MEIRDNRVKVRNKVKFEDLDIGDVYEFENDEGELVIGIKTNYHFERYNCIFLLNPDRNEWEPSYEDGDFEVVKVATELVLRRDL